MKNPKIPKSPTLTELNYHIQKGLKLKGLENIFNKNEDSFHSFEKE